MKSVCVFCASGVGNDPAFIDIARATGEAIAERGLQLVFGGGRVGLMGVIADTVLEANGEAIGVIPQSLVDKEVAHTGLTELHVTTSMHERKARMADLSDGFIALPGGFGTLDELFEIVTWSQLGYHDKPIGLVDVDAFFATLKTFFDEMVNHGFVQAAHRQQILEADTPGALLDVMCNWHPTALPKWSNTPGR